MKLYEAYDVVDAYGADPDRWPAADRAGVEALIRTDAKLAEYVSDMAKLDSQLSEWKEDEDGADVSGDSDNPGDQNDDDADDEDEGDNDPDSEGDNGDGDGDDGDEDGANAGGQADGEGEDDDADDTSDGPRGHGGGLLGHDLGMDLSDAKDIDGALNEEIERLLKGAFDDSLQVCFTRDLDRIEPYDDSKGNEPNVKAIETAIHTTIAPMQKELQRLIVARSAAVMTPGFRRGRINPAALHRAPTGDDRLFRRKQEAVTNKVAISLVIDNSGSMCGRHNGSKIDTAMKSAWAFAETLDRLKIPCDVVGFTNIGFPVGHDIQAHYDEAEKFAATTGVRMDVIRLNPFYMPIYKGFDEKFGPKQKRRMAHLIENQGILMSNNDALALEYAGKRLKARTETRKIMIVFSDGQPADIYDDRALYRSVKKNVKQLEREGVEVIGIGIQSNAVEQFYSKSHVLMNVAELPAFVMKQLKALIAPPR